MVTTLNSNDLEPGLAQNRYQFLPVAIAKKGFGWKNVHKHNWELIRKKQDKARRSPTLYVPDYSNDQRHADAINERMKQLGRWDRYMKGLYKITKAKKLPSEMDTPEQRSRAALKALDK